MHSALRHLEHRPVPLPRAPWLIAMRWLDLAFLHWPVRPAALRPHLPPDLELDLRDGAAWLGVVPFRMTGVRARCLPPLPGSGAFPELNLRTYVRAGDLAGVWFFSLDAGSRIAVRAARATFRLPYFDAAMQCTRDGDTVHYRSRRTHRGAPPAEFQGAWRPTAGHAVCAPGTLPHWLTERYVLFASGRDGRVRVGHVHHPPWMLAPAEVEIDCCDMTRLVGLAPEGPPLVHAAAPQAVAAWAPQRLG